MTNSAFCPECGARLETSGPLQSLCPACLLNPQRAAEPAFSEHHEFPDRNAIQRLFPALEIEQLLGRGGMGVVYQARQVALERHVALKLLSPKLAAQPSFAERFVREAKTLAKLRHPNIVSIYDFGQVGNIWYLVMEYVDGRNLRELLNAGALAPNDALSIVQQVCAGLEYAHEQGVVHRDIKPENILVNRQGEVALVDFGLAKLMDPLTQDVTLTGTSQVMGTLHYMAPEQMRGPMQVDHRADLYSLGVVFYEMLTKELPLGRFPLPSEHGAGDARWDQVVLKALAKEPDHRYQCASQIQSDLQAAVGAPARKQDQPPAMLNTDARSGCFLDWVQALPWPAATTGFGALTIAWCLSGTLVWNRELHEEWVAMGYPFAALAFFLGLYRGELMSDTSQRRGLLAGGAFTSIAILAATSGDFRALGLKFGIEILAGGLMFTAHLVWDRWLQRGAWVDLLPPVVLGIVAALLHGSLYFSQGQAAFYYGTGISALLATASLLVRIPSTFEPGPRKVSSGELLRSFAFAVAFGAAYFNQYLF